MPLPSGGRLVRWRCCCCFAHWLWISRVGAIIPTDTALKMRAPSTES
jgi:hypothetical protein